MSDTGKIIALAKAVGARPDPEDVKQNIEDWLDDHPEATTTVQDGSITREKLSSGLEADITAVENGEAALNSAVVKLDGIDKTFNPTKISGLNMPTNGTEYASGSNYETYYVPVKKDVNYVWTADKSTATPSVRLAFAESLPANGVSCTFIAEKVIYGTPVKFDYTPSKNGYLSLSVWKNQTSADLMSIHEFVNGDVDDLLEVMDAISAKIDTSVFIGNYSRQIEVEEPKIMARRLIYYTGESTPATWPGGLAIYKNLAFIGYNYGYVGAFDLTTGAIVALGQTANNEHVNNMFFDYSKMYGDFPVLYLSHCRESATNCNVYTVTINNGVITLTRIQTIVYSGAYYSSEKTVDWSYDENNDALVAVIGNNSGSDKILRFAKPKPFRIEVVLTDADILTEATTTAITVRQGNVITNGIMLILDGSSNGTLYAIDILTGQTVNSFSLSGLYTGEPEGIAIYGGKVYVNFHVGSNVVSANLFELTF